MATDEVIVETDKVTKKGFAEKVDEATDKIDEAAVKVEGFFKKIGNFFKKNWIWLVVPVVTVGIGMLVGKFAF